MSTGVMVRLKSWRRYATAKGLANTCVVKHLTVVLLRYRSAPTINAAMTVWLRTHSDMWYRTICVQTSRTQRKVLPFSHYVQHYNSTAHTKVYWNQTYLDLYGLLHTLAATVCRNPHGSAHSHICGSGHLRKLCEYAGIRKVVWYRMALCGQMQLCE